MEIFKAVLYILVGAAGVIWAADRFTDGAANLAYRFHIPPVIVGLTVVAFGTSAPELFVSLMSAVQGSSAMAVANVIGSNIFNVFCIGGITAAVTAVDVSRETLRRDIPVVLVTSLLLVVLNGDGRLSFADGALLFISFIGYTLWLIRSAMKVPQPQAADIAVRSFSWSIFGILLGLAGLVLCSSLFVQGASAVAGYLGVSDAVIGLTIVAGGTSLPELATSVVAARKGQSALAIGNVIGSCVFNILLILGLTGMVCPLTIEGITWLDYVMMTMGTVLFGLFCSSRRRLSRAEGWILLLLFIAYMVWLVATA